MYLEHVHVGIDVATVCFVGTVAEPIIPLSRHRKYTGARKPSEYGANVTYFNVRHFRDLERVRGVAKDSYTHHTGDNATFLGTQWRDWIECQPAGLREELVSVVVHI